MGSRSTVPTRDVTTVPAGYPGSREDEGNAQRRLVDQDRVSDLVVLPEALAVVRNHGHDRVVFVARGPEPFQDASELCIGERDLAVVGPVLERRVVRRRRPVGRVRIVEVEPGQEGPPVLVSEPGQGRVHRFVGRALRGAGGPALGFVEALAEVSNPCWKPKAAGDRVGRDEGPGAIALPLEEGGQGQVLRAQGEDDVVAHAVHGRVVAGQDGGVRRAGERNGGQGVLEARSAPCEGIEHGGARPRVAIGAEAVRAQGVDRHQENVRMGRDGGRWRSQDAATTKATRTATAARVQARPRRGRPGRPRRYSPAPGRASASSCVPSSLRILQNKKGPGGFAPGPRTTRAARTADARRCGPRAG